MKIDLLTGIEGRALHFTVEVGLLLASELTATVASES